MFGMFTWILCWAMLLLSSSVLKSAEGVSWLAIAALSSDTTQLFHAASDCEQHPSVLTKRQAAVCARNIELMEPVRQGAKEAIGECQYQFKDDRWNCPVMDAVSAFGVVPESGTREGAFLHAVSSAGVAHSVTRACSSGLITGCGCDQTVTGYTDDGFKWSGCSDNTDFGVAFAQSFIDSHEGGEKIGNVRDRTDTNPLERGIVRPASDQRRNGTKDRAETQRNKDIAKERVLLNLHNNNVGRKLLDLSREIKCKCHGVSGSCEVKTCFRTLPTFRQIGDALRASYASAEKVHAVRTGSRITLVPVPKAAGPTRRVLPSSGDMSTTDLLTSAVNNTNTNNMQNENNLVFADESPAYCEFDAKSGTLGTAGRLCNVTSRGSDGCEEMCCGRGHLTRVRTVTERCECRFKYCCYVACRTCTRVVEEYVCR